MVTAAPSSSPDVSFVSTTRPLTSRLEEIVETWAKSQYDLVTLSAEFADSPEWILTGSPTAAHWLAIIADVEPCTAREWIRIGRLLKTLPATADALKTRQISYSKVRTLTRLATPENELELLDIAMTTTAADLGRALAAWLHRNSDPEDIAAHHQRQRSVKWRTEPDGMVTFTLRLPPLLAGMLIAFLTSWVMRTKTLPPHPPQLSTPWGLSPKHGYPLYVEIADSAIDLIGNTPMVRLNAVTEDAQCPIVAKLEFTNPGGSAKDRPALWMINDAEAKGLLKPGGTIVEPTSGNTGVGLAIVASQRGYKCVFVMTDKVSPEKVDLLRAYGAEVVVCPVAVPPEDPQSYYSVAERLVNEIPDAYRPNQYANQSNPESHYATTGPEIWRQTEGKVTHFVAGAGTGGTLGGVARYLKEQNPNIQIIAADPEGSVYSGGSGRPYLVEGVGEDFWPETYDQTVVDRVIAISDADSFLMARRVSEEEGLLIGGSCGTAVAAARVVAAEADPDDLVVVLIPDSGRGYLSKVFNDDWMASFGFLEDDGPTVRDALAASVDGVPALLYVQPEDSARTAFAMMQTHGVSQLPVAKGPMPLSAAEVQGSVTELRLMQLAYGDQSTLDMPVEKIMGPKLPTLGAGQSVSLAVEMLDGGGASLVLDGGRPIAVITQSDILQFLAQGS